MTVRAFKLKIAISVAVVLVILFLYYWEWYFDKSNPFVSYFSRPSNMWSYVTSHSWSLFTGALTSTLVALISLVISAVLAILFLVIDLWSDDLLRIIEYFAAVSQTIPLPVIVLLSYLAEDAIFQELGWRCGYVWYCFAPVSIALFFPPLAYGIKGVRDVDLQVKASLRVWNAPRWWRIKRVYLPQSLPHVLTGLRVSSTWAAVAVFITEGLLPGLKTDDNFSIVIGRGLMMAFRSSEHGKSFALTIIATLLGLLIYCLVNFVQNVLQKRYFGEALDQEKNYPISG